MEVEYKNIKSYDDINKINEQLLKENEYLKNKVAEQKKQLEEITQELKEFNVMLEDEINERTKTEDALKESERQFRYSIEEAPVPMMLYTEDGEIKKINRTWTDITGYTISDIPTIYKWAEAAGILINDLKGNYTSRLFNLEKRQDDGEYP